MEWRLDYIEREIQKLSLILNTIFRSVNVPEPLTAETPVTQVYNQLLHWEHQPDDELLHALEDNKAYHSENIRLLADIYFERYQHHPQNQGARGKALLLYRYYTQKSKNTLNFLVYNRIHALEKVPD